MPLTFVIAHEGNRVVIDPPEGLIEPRPAIEVVDYDPEWPRMFEAEAERLREKKLAGKPCRSLCLRAGGSGHSSSSAG